MSSHPLTVEVIEDAAAFRALRPEWTELATRVGLDHPFATHEWLTSWWSAFGGRGKRLHVAVVRDGARCVGVAPLMRTDATMAGVPLRRLELIGNEHSPRNELLLGDGAAADALMADLLGRQGDWDALVLPQLPAGSASDAALERLQSQPDLRANIWTAPASPVVRTDGDYEAYLASRPKRLRSNLRNRLKRIEKVGPVRYEKVCGGPALEAALDDALRLEACGWKGVAGSAIASHPDTRKLYLGFAEEAAARGWLELRFLTVADRRVAMAYNLRYRNRVYGLKHGHDTELAPLAPSALLFAEIVRECFAEKVEVFDLLGDDEPWKLQWTSDTHPHRWWFVFSRSWRGRLARALKFDVGPALRDGPLAPLLRRAAAVMH